MNYSRGNCSPYQTPTVRSPKPQESSRLNVRESLEIRRRRAEARNYLKWGFINIVLLTLLMIDRWQTCDMERVIFTVEWFWFHAETAGILINSLSCLACFGKYLCWLMGSSQVCVTEMQRCLLDEMNENSFKTIKKSQQPRSFEADSDVDDSVPIINWHSSFEDSRWGNKSSRRSPSPLRTPQQQQQQQQQQSQFVNQSLNNNSMNASNLSEESAYMSPYAEVCREDFPTDVRQLPALLKRAERERERSYAELQDSNNMQHMASANSFWNYCNNAAHMLKRTMYQLAPAPVISTENAPTSIEDFGGVLYKDGNSEVIKRISTVKLSQYLSNLRYWISSTILQRLVKQIAQLDEVFRQRGLSDLKIGAVGLERLRKLAENQQFVQSCAPTLPLLLPFLDTFSNQEYLVQRIKELAQGSCIGDYRWNSGKTHNGEKWGEHLPTDTAILFHIFCAYLDSQLLPLPQGGGRPFHSRYVIQREEKRTTKDIISAVNNKAHCGILVSNHQLKPKFNFISDKELHNCAYDRNNLFYVIIQFLIYMRAQQDSSLESVNLGKSGINLMCVIED
ncbi:CG6479 [Drosophila busckii]|uniref:CG6479 n=1 Tax=Drosophila busckii TaxID=30019 RepID=A0A0M5J482_DROBS|nr:transmembrane protein 209 [Drosophila busckii]ALC44961.1 CG6479 [Drosophila busckii]